MRVPSFLRLVLSVVAGATALPVHAQGRGDPAVLLAAQRDAMAPLAYMDGIWRGSAWTILPSGQKHTITQTERIGPFLDGSVKVFEGRGYEPDGRVSFNALGVLSYNPSSKSYSLHSYAMGNEGSFALTPSATGYVWEIPAGPMTIRYTMTLEDGKWHEVGDRIMPGQPPVRFFDMLLTRVGDTTWPASGAVPPR